MNDKIIDSFDRYWSQVLENLPEIIVGLVLLVVFVFIGVFSRRLVLNRLQTRIQDRLLLNFVGRVVFLTFLIIGVVIFLNQVGLGSAASGLLAGAGVSALILGFAFKDIGENFLAGFFLAFSRPFSIGDIIEVEGLVGSVKAMSFRNSHIRTFDGRDIFIPNAMMIKNPLTNYTKDGLMRHDFVIGIDYGENVADATAAILSTLYNMSNIVQKEGLEPFVTIENFGTSTINLKIYFWINTYDFLGSTTVLKSTVMQQVVNKLMSEGFNLPADIIELKIYQEGQPIPVALKDFDKKGGA
ncbi:mechanosensitive ion channel family protein [Fulvivirga sp. RKSG066]|uniref:mechanosensitive ion channel family protein n=1 Tax=Fulvivirga aurantia TaxID=2529383 RepID=UPI0012BB60CA|nr:mechanosensitive ion channel family protein [Fulvivirga aurantia]MTI20816.1 mechanosensitive ion channel family protein [Fulvivirga aurantia]